MGAVLQDTYEITSLLGKGGMGEVFLARHRRLPGRQVAVKVLRTYDSVSPELYGRFRREAEISSQLGHPNIVEVFDFDTLPDGTPCLVMEYLRGETLEQRLKRGRLAIDEALSIIRQIGSALQATHRAGIVHRDLKPANVFLMPTDSGGVVGERVKLLDFGISKLLDVGATRYTQDAVMIGTPQYMAPEQVMGKNQEVDARTDLFALGGVVYEMLSGRPPFGSAGGSVVQLIFQIVQEQPEPLTNLRPDVPARVVAALERALAKSQQDRHPDVAAFILELTGSPLQSLSDATPARSVAQAAPVPSAAAEEGGLASTHVPSSTARFPAPGVAEEGGLAATHVPSSTARLPAPAPVSVPPPPEVAPVAVARATPARSTPKVGVMAGAGVLILGCVAAGWWFGSRAAPAPVGGESVTVVAPALPPPTPSPPEPMPAAVADAEREEAAEDAREEAEAEQEAAAVVERQRPSLPARSASAPVPEAVREELEAAERALDAGQIEEAIRLARRSQQTQVTPASYSVLARAHCRQGDLSNARAQWRRLPAGEQRQQVRRYCSKYDLDL